MKQSKIKLSNNNRYSSSVNDPAIANAKKFMWSASPVMKVLLGGGLIVTLVAFSYSTWRGYLYGSSQQMTEPKEQNLLQASSKSSGTSEVDGDGTQTGPSSARKLAAQMDKVANGIAPASNTSETPIVAADQLQRIRHNEEQLPLLETMRRHYADFNDVELAAELVEIKGQIHDGQWVERANSGKLSREQNFEFQELLRRHDALHLEKAERALAKAQRLLAESQIKRLKTTE